MKMWKMGPKVVDDGSIFPYLKCLGFIFRSDLSSTKHNKLHNFVHFVGAFLDKARSKKSKFLDGHSDNDVFVAFMCDLAKQGSISGTKLEDTHDQTATLRGPRVRSNILNRSADSADLWIAYFGSEGGSDYVREELSRLVSSWKGEWDNTIRKFLHERF